MISRRNFLLGLVAAPAIIRTPGILMPVRKIFLPEPVAAIEPLPPGAYAAELVAGDYTRNVMRLVFRLAATGQEFTNKVHL